MTDLTRRQIAFAAVVAAVGSAAEQGALLAEPARIGGLANRFGFSFYFEVKGDIEAARKLHSLIQGWMEDRNDDEWPKCEQIFIGSSKVEAIDPPSV